MYSNNSTVVPDSYVIDTKVVHIETYDAPGDFSQVATKKYPTEVSISTMFIDIISTKSKKITLVYKNHKDLEKSTYYIPIFEPRDSTYEDELMEHLDENAYKG